MMTSTSKTSMADATEAMIADAEGWLTPLDAPAVAQLRILADQLDSEATAALATSYGTAYRALIKRAPTAKTNDDELGDLLDDLD